jgi:hypothetical protein
MIVGIAFSFGGKCGIMAQTPQAGAGDDAPAGVFL